MYTQDKTHRITLRLNDEQFEHVTRTAKVMGVSPSELLRIFINVSIASEKYPDDVEKAVVNFVERNGAGRENDKTDINDNV
jgi:antitoxin component of RelBE/YafQ-DinJ toxin-antitoxin module